jgi:hypothetical protein
VQAVVVNGAVDAAALLKLIVTNKYVRSYQQYI